jgi:hypothetical protein
MAHGNFFPAALLAQVARTYKACMGLAKPMPVIGAESAISVSDNTEGGEKLV